MSFIESPRFPDVIAFSAIGGPGFNTSVVTLASGYESRNINWSASRYGYDLAIPVRTQTEVDTINAFFRNANGKAHGFRFKDWADYAASLAPTITLTTKTFQLQKTYVTGSLTSNRIITKPVASSLEVFVNAVKVTSGYTVNSATGIITFTDVPAGAVTWSGEFDVPVRFDTDSLQWRVIDKGSDSLLYQVEQLPLVEVRI